MIWPVAEMIVKLGLSPQGSEEHKLMVPCGCRLCYRRFEYPYRLHLQGDTKARHWTVLGGSPVEYTPSRFFLKLRRNIVAT